MPFGWFSSEPEDTSSTPEKNGSGRAASPSRSTSAGSRASPANGRRAPSLEEVHEEINEMAPLRPPLSSPAHQSMPIWPRTMSGDDLEVQLGLKPMGIGREGLPLGFVDESPHQTPPARPLWPRTMSGDDLELLAGLKGPSGSSFDIGDSPGSLGYSSYDGTPAAVTVGGSPAQGMPISAPPPQQAPCLMPLPMMPPPPQISADGLGEPKVINLSDILKQPELGSPEYPTEGSGNHATGGCKPCAFLHTKGCQNGVSCPFCHLCEAGEKKKRQKERKDFLRSIGRAGPRYPNPNAGAGYYEQLQ